MFHIGAILGEKVIPVDGDLCLVISLSHKYTGIAIRTGHIVQSIITANSWRVENVHERRVIWSQRHRVHLHKVRIFYISPSPIKNITFWSLGQENMSALVLANEPMAILTYWLRATHICVAHVYACVCIYASPIFFFLVAIAIISYNFQQKNI